jgi:excisionase family DNA binding protein
MKKTPDAHQPPPMRAAYRLAEGCKELGISRSTAYRLYAAGKIKLVKIGGRTLIPGAEIARLASEGVK